MDSPDSSTSPPRKLRMGMIGGGQGAFIGNVHRMAAMLDGQIELVCGAFSADPARALASGQELYLPSNRIYGSYPEMFTREAALPASERMDFVTIVTPNFLHFPMAKAALEAGFHVVCDKPMTCDLAEARELAALVASTGRLFALTHNYTGYPMVKEAREIVRGGRLGALRKVVVEYPQGWLSSRLEAAGHKQAAWRADPSRSGATNCMGDIGTHAENLAEYITGLRIKEVAADVSTFVEGRTLDDDGNVLVRFEGGAKGVLHVSQISAGEENALSIRVYGENGGLHWRQEEPNSLTLTWLDRPRETLRAGQAYLGETARTAGRLPPGHPEGFIEAFANLYRNFAGALHARLAGKESPAAMLDFPSAQDGVRGLAFIQAVLASSRRNSAWTAVQE